MKIIISNKITNGKIKYGIILMSMISVKNKMVKFKIDCNNENRIKTFAPFFWDKITNAVEALHRQFRKATKTKSLFPNYDAHKKMLFIAYTDISKKWSTPIRNWRFIISNLSIIFNERFINSLK